MKIKINSDVLNISQRIKNIDKNYYIIFNTEKNVFEMHNSNQFGSTYCLTLPFNYLDERVLKYVRKTQSDNIDDIIEEIETRNNILESANRSSAFSIIGETLEDLLERKKWEF